MTDSGNSGSGSPPPPGSLRKLVSNINPVLKKTLGRIQALPIFPPAPANPTSPDSPLPPPAVSPQVKNASLNRTAIDMEACMMVLSRAVTGQEAKVKEQQASHAAQPLKSVEEYRRALPCNSQWEAMTGTSRFRLCSECKLNIYDFSNLSQEEAEELVFQREGQAPKALYQRKDGRFLTTDCPVALQRCRTIIAATVCTVLIAAGLIAAYVMQPPPAPEIQQIPLTPAPATPKQAGKNSTLQPAATATGNATFDPTTGTMILPVSERTGPAVFTPERINNPVVNAEVERYLQAKGSSDTASPEANTATNPSSTPASEPGNQPDTNNEAAPSNPYVKNY